MSKRENVVRTIDVAHQFDSFRELLEDPTLGENLVGAKIHVSAAGWHLATVRVYMTRVAPT